MAVISGDKVDQGRYKVYTVLFACYPLLYYVLLFLLSGETRIRISDVMLITAPLLSAWACFKAHRRSGTVKNGWLYLSLGLVAWALGQIVWSLPEFLDGQPTSGSYLSDIGYTLYAFFCVAGFYRFVKRKAILRHVMAVLADAGILTLAVVLFLFYISSDSSTLPVLDIKGTVSFIGYVFRDTATLFFVIKLMGSKDILLPRRCIKSFLAAAIALIVVNLLYILSYTHNNYMSGSYLDPLWSMGFLLEGYSAIVYISAISTGSDFENITPSDSVKLGLFSEKAVYFLSVAVFAFILVWRYIIDRSYDLVGIGMMVFGVFVFSRQFLMLVDNSELHCEQASLLEQLEEANGELRKQVDRNLTLGKISKSVMTLSIEYNYLMTKIARLISESLNDPCFISLLTPEGDRLKIVAFHHPDSIRNDALQGVVRAVETSVESSIVASVIAEGRSSIINNIREEHLADLPDEYVQLIKQNKTFNMLMVPLKSSNETIGVLGTFRVSSNGYTINDRSFLELAADRAAIVILNGKLISEIQENRKNLARLSKRIVEIQEGERRFLAKELHDEIGQTLSAMKINIDIVKAKYPDIIELDNSQTLLRDLLADIRQLSLDLRPTMLDDLGLLPALLWLVERYTEQTGIKIEINHAGLYDKRFNSDVETAVYRVIQESLNNTAKHSGATRVEISILMDGQKVKLELSDNGNGFDMDDVQILSSVGISGMRERINLLDGSFGIESVMGSGTTVSVEVPIAG